MKRFVFDNLIYKVNEEAFLIMNLISFRRETITKDALNGLISIEDKLEAGKFFPVKKRIFWRLIGRESKYCRKKL